MAASGAPPFSETGRPRPGDVQRGASETPLCAPEGPRFRLGREQSTARAQVHAAGAFAAPPGARGAGGGGQGLPLQGPPVSKPGSGVDPASSYPVHQGRPGNPKT
ncbi:Oxygen-Dependent Coproporphyrinogen-Iii Oxidase [Manis pentadactyla]|nr:Oxygen-Dependent Coproporphyrinogen-Iii Oxidase [Manis pentadactyla]